METLVDSCESLLKGLREHDMLPKEEFHTCFDSLGRGEANDTYLKTTSKLLGTLVADIENYKNLSFIESGLIEEFESILNYLKCAEDFLVRVDTSVNTYLFWEEETKQLE